ncbi:NrfD/PsrC family molybdoenzyme membrane anchor subunit [Bacillus sp. B15-48]|uniref:NrfD/PsrC family molybdoenzyme membrane anchor subunit n=1 Tax=Bacillus sp. B15-48 TaxID=1548601 RepID=UPI001940102E|nr:NrfD/PsrC family molybdoenzyme membrane anchor subunit [Bacillus sp. B15-48]MBM4763031.1 oxidoreductase [Bacillus sp. B15-48]
MHWHWLIVIYLFLGGLGAGTYLTSFAAEKGWLGKSSSLTRMGYYLAPPIVTIGTVLLVFDLGQGLTKPWLLIGLIMNPRSVMTWGVYILALFIVVGLIKAYFTFKNKATPNIVTITGAVLALATCAYTGLLLTVIKAVPFWATGIMPVLFVVSAISTGLSLTSLLAILAEKERFTEGREGQAHILLIGAELIIVAVFVGIMFFGVNGPVGKESVELVVTGAYSLVFWGYFIGLGLLFPLFVFIYQHRKSKQSAVNETLSAASEIAATVQKKHHSFLTIVSDISVIIGGFALRALIILAAIPVWDGFTIY